MSVFPSAISEILQTGRIVASHAPWPRLNVEAQQWEGVIAQLAAGTCTLVSQWGESDRVHMAVRSDSDIFVLSLECPEGCFPSVGAVHSPAIRLERAVNDLFGLVPTGTSDSRPWLDHGRWGVKHPMGGCSRGSDAPVGYEFLPVEGESLHTIPVGPVHAGIIEPGHFRFTVNGEAVVRLEERFGYVHKGIGSLMNGQSVERAARIAARTSGDSTVAYSLGFSRAVEAALGIEAPPRAQCIRALMAELERLANHCGDIGAICNDATFTLLHAHCSILREQVLRAADTCFGHRLMMDRIIPGGVTTDLKSDGKDALRGLLATFKLRFPKLVALYDNTPSLQDRTVATGILRKTLADQYGCGGYIGRASGRSFDARKSIGYPPYDTLVFEVPVLEEGDVGARVWLRIREVEQSLKLVEQLMVQLADGATFSEPKPDGDRDREGAALVEGFRGDIFVWLRLARDGGVGHCHLRDPSWFQWPLLEAAIEGNIVADFPLCNKSFNCSYSGHDL
ncbi:MAG: NADH-quinone oxidoreductase subunit C [Micropepsaceae bacterium]